MEETRLYKGYWWLPSSEEEQVAGMLTIESNGTLRLELYGCFGTEEKFLDFDKEDENVIWGRCYAPNGHMKDIALFECRPAISYNFSSGFPIVRYSCRYALIGFHTDSMSSPSFFEAQIDYEELAYWCPPKNISISYNNSSITIALDRSKERETLASISLDGGIKLSLKQGFSYIPEYPKINIDQATYVEVAKEGLTGLDAISAARKFEKFLSLAMLSPVEHGKIMLRSRNCYQDMNNGEHYYHSIELVTYLYNGEKTPQKKKPDLLFKYDDVGSVLESMYAKFCIEKRMAQIWSNLIDSLERKRVFTSNDFLVVIQALDGFSIRFRKEQDFLLQITALRDEFKDVKRIKLTDDDLKRAKGSRHYYSHILKLEEKEKKNAIEGANLFDLTRKLRVLLICCALNFLGFDNTKINEMLNKCRNSILRV